MRYKYHQSLLVIFALFTSLGANAQAIALADVLAATLEHQAIMSTATAPPDINNTQAFSWLDGAPSLSAMYLHNQTDNGSKEAELSLNLPIKSQLRKQLEQNLSASSEQLQLSTQRQHALYYSGIIRDLVWQDQLHQAQLTSVARKETLLSSLLAQYKRMAELNALPQYALFVLQKELSDTRIVQLEHQHKLSSILSQYQNITGLQSMPDNITESIPSDLTGAMISHPDVLILDASWSAFAQSIQGQSKSAQAWDLTLTAKRVDSGAFSENQLGMGVNIPLDIGNALSPSAQNEYRQAQLKYELERRQILLNLMIASKEQVAQHQFLVNRQSMLDDSQGNLRALEQALKLLLDANTPNQALHIRNFIDLIDAQSEISLNHIAMQHQVAQIKQTLGLSL